MENGLKAKFSIWIFVTLCNSVLTSAHAQKLPLAEILNWQPQPNNICYGVFVDPKEVANTKPMASINQSPMNVTSNNPTTFSLKGESTISGKVTIQQPGRLLQAEHVTFNRNPKTQSIDKIELRENVRYFEQKQELAGQHVIMKPDQQETNLWDGAYRFYRDALPHPLTAWGTAKQAQNLPNELKIQQATYSTCPLCIKPLWKLQAKQLDIKKEEGIGVANHVSLNIKNVPVVYWPYLSFPIDKRRKSGFLLPTPGHNNKDGFILEVPYYCNLAPNYDALFTPILYSNRGLQLNANIRYLFPHSKGFMHASFLPSDNVFANMKKEELDNPDEDRITKQFLHTLANDSDNRLKLALQNTSEYSQKMESSVIINFVTDDYYLQDFGHNPTDKNSDQLLNQANFNYSDNHWDFLSRLQLHQTLHPIDSSTKDQYARLPQLDLHGDWLFGKNYPHTWVNSEFIYFDHRRDFMTHRLVVTGQRLDVSPGVELPLKTEYAYFTPRIDMEGTAYWLHDEAHEFHHESNNSITRLLPITTIDAGLFFERTHSLGNSKFTQTLEPRAYYVYIPYTNQNDIPLFDTDLPTFTYQQLYIPNRFSGIDRINDANQVTVGLTTRFLDQNDGDERLSASLATQWYFQERKVCLTPDCRNDPLINNHTSPLIGALNYQINKAWSAVANVVWDPSDQRMTTTNTHLHYHDAKNRLFSCGYDYVRDGDPKLGARSQDLSRLDIAFALPITERWHILANWNYNLSHSHPQFALAGFEYQSCCFALRAIASRTMIDQSLTEDTLFDNRYYIQINLKGLTTVGNSNPNSILKDRLPGFRDLF